MKKKISELIITHPFIIDKFEKMPFLFRTLARCVVFFYGIQSFLYIAKFYIATKNHRQINLFQEINAI